MTKDEILEKSRKENQNKDLYDMEVQKIAFKVSYYAAFGVCALITILSSIFKGKPSLECWIVFFGMLSTTFLVKFIKMHKVHELFIFIGYFVLFVLSLLNFIFRLIGVIR